MTDNKKQKTRFDIGDIVKLNGCDEMGFVKYYKHGKVFVDWIGRIDVHDESDLCFIA